ncbi:MAG: NAD(P)/FAD-dependent oxidoreductase [Acidobacteriota bacterium]
MADVGVTVVGGGVVGLAVAERLAEDHESVVLLERHPKLGAEQSSRNSEVIHAGIPYPGGSLKARLCVEGRDLLYARCAGHGIPHRRIGKLFVATDGAEAEILAGLLARGRDNGVELSWLDAAAVARLEPHVRAHAAILSPFTGIVSAHGLVSHLAAALARKGGVIRTSSELVSIEKKDGYALGCLTPSGLESFTTEVLVNAAGLGAGAVATLAGIDVAPAGYRVHPCKGSYFGLRRGGADLVSRLVYPLPDAHSLGIHAVLGLDGRLRFGPDVEYLGGGPVAFDVDERRAASFGAAIRRYLPAVRDEDLVPESAGVRAKLQGPGEPFRDFVIREESDRGLPGLIDLVGIESPGLTASLAIARMVAALL